jgi:hypothetical protein
MKKKQLKEIIRKVVTEISATGGGVAGAGMSTGAGEQYATPFAFNPNKKAKGTSRNYYLKMGWKPVNKEQMRKQAKGMEYKDLWK